MSSMERAQRHVSSSALWSLSVPRSRQFYSWLLWRFPYVPGYRSFRTSEGFLSAVCTPIFVTIDNCSVCTLYSSGGQGTKGNTPSQEECLVKKIWAQAVRSSALSDSSWIGVACCNRDAGFTAICAARWNARAPDCCKLKQSWNILIAS